MQQKVIEHKLRKIEFEYDDSKPWTQADETLVKTFLDIHDWEQQRSELGRFLLQHYSELDKRVDQARELLNKVKETFTNTRIIADGLPAFTTLKPAAVDAFYQQLAKTSAELMEYDAIMRAIDMGEFEKEKSKYFAEQDHPEVWDKFSEADLAHSQSWKENSIDIVSFSRADEGLRSFISVTRRSGDSIMDCINRVIGNHARLMLETEMQYELWKEFHKRIALFEHFTGRDKPEGDYFNAN
jgi:hypothetical protein